MATVSQLAQQRKGGLAQKGNVLAAFVLVGLFIAALLFTVSTAGERASIAVVALGAASVGSLLGILFGVPKDVEDPNAPAAEEITSQEAITNRAVLVRRNSNLAKVSDWLTTLLIGAGLVELGSFGPAFAKLNASLAEGIASQAPVERVQVLVGGTIIYWVVVGFIAGWLSASVILLAVFERRDEQVTE
jgi:hypothetical protein